MKTYITTLINGYYVDYPEEIDHIYWDGKIGHTYEDFKNGKWVLLSDSQIKFHQDNPKASIKEVLDEKIESNISPIRTIEHAKDEKIMDIDSFDNSDSVNTFYINNEPMWLNVDDRQRLLSQITANESVGRTEMTKWFEGKSYTFTITQWKQMLAQLEVYAGDSKNVTEQHKNEVQQLTTIEDVDNYDYTIGYPSKLRF